MNVYIYILFIKNVIFLHTKQKTFSHLSACSNGYDGYERKLIPLLAVIQTHFCKEEECTTFFFFSFSLRIVDRRQ